MPSTRIAIIGAGPVGLALALLLASRVPDAHVSLHDARPLDKGLHADRRTLALALGSVQLLERLRAWHAADAQPITQVHVSQQPPTVTLAAGPPFAGRGAADASVTLRAADLGVPMLGAVLPYGAMVTRLQHAWLDAAAAQPQRCATRFGAPVKAVRVLDAAGGARPVEVDADIAESFDLVVIAEGGVFAEQARKAIAHDYAQTAWVGTVQLDAAGATPGLAIERFTRQGPAALLPLPSATARDGTPAGPAAALVWCVPRDDDPVRDLDDAQRVAVLNTLFPPEAGRITALAAPLKAFPLGLNAERTLVDAGGPIVRIGNAAQTLHPVAGQGLNLGLRDAYALADALRREVDTARAETRAVDVMRTLRRVEWQRAPDRWALIGVTDFLARSFTWSLPGLGAARGAGLALLDHAPPLKALLARRMMFGTR